MTTTALPGAASKEQAGERAALREMGDNQDNLGASTPAGSLREDYTAPFDEQRGG